MDKIKNKGKKELSGFKSFAIQGNIIDLAVGVIIGGAFGKIVSSLVSDVIMPCISLISGSLDFTNMFIAFDGNSYDTLDKAKEAGVATLNYGLFLTTVIDFLLIALSVFIVMRQLSKLKQKPPPPPVAEITEKDCPYCISKIHIKAVKCPNCISELPNEKTT